MSTVNFFSPVQESLQLVDARMRSISNQHHPELGVALEHLLSSGGKRIRPAIALLTGGMFGAEAERLITLGAAIELLHTATLVHDDLIDGALLRRGIATLNAQWSPAATVLTGDFIFAGAARLAAETDSVAVMRLFSETLAIIVNGEITQMFASFKQAGQESYLRRIYAKTASMFVLATTAPALLSAVDENMLEHARAFGHEIGMAFQIVDDVLDFTGEQKTVGKPLANDLRQGVITLPTLYYLKINPEDSNLHALLNGNLYNGAGMDSLVESIRQSGAIQQALDDAQGYAERGLVELSYLPECPEQAALEDLTRYIVRRQL